ncbi:MAG TPA: DUF2157 domain-containing protein [Gammaproteobacteria bacterium]|nr:DUF2157 domain-containing protein [Gammaproteobacteria bacterium]
MNLTRRQADIVKKALKSWQVSNKISPAKAEELTDSIKVIPFDWRRLAKFSIFTAIVCFFIAISAAFNDEYLRRVLAAIFNAPPAIKSFFLAIISCLLYYFGYRRKQRYPQKTYTNEAIFVFGIAATAAAIYQLGQALQLGADELHLYLFMACIVYGLIGYLCKSVIIWVFALVSLGGWFGAETGYLSGWGAYYFGMNYPLRFVLFGALLVFVAFYTEKYSKFKWLHESTLTMGLLYLFMSLWILSIFGDFDWAHNWHEIKHIELFHWSLLFGIAAVAAIWYGLKYDNSLTKGFGITFLFINLYTRYFEYFWDTMHKALFFLVLGLSLWFIGTKAENIWRLGERKKRK